MSMKSEKYFGMGNLEKEIWHQFADSASVEEICPRLVEDYDVDLETCTADVLKFVQRLYDRQLLEAVEVPVG